MGSRFVLSCLFVLWLAAQSVVRAERLPRVPDIYSPDRVAPTAPSSTDYLAQARRACEAGSVGEALRLATLAAQVESEEAVTARRVLGYQRARDQWAGRYAARRIAKGEIWNPRFGWIESEDVPRWLDNERPFGRRWISADEDARRHATIDDGWRVRTDHFRVTTNHSRESAAKLAARLEMLYQVWLQQFGGFYLTSGELVKRFDGRETSGYRSKPFEVIYYRTREEYNAALRRRQPRIDMTLGIYFDDTRTTHFFAGDDQDPGTIYHEAVHQFFHESRRAARDVGANSNAWLIEGVACYFESLTEHCDGSDVCEWTIGTPTAGRLPAAWHRRMVNDYYVPLAELSALGIQDFQQRNDLPRLYSQSAGLVTFLMQYESGKYRKALVETLQRLYTGRDRPSTLAQLTGQSFAALDQEYQQYLQSLPLDSNSQSRVSSN
ncbi:MAG: hypothetical protein AAGD11_18650 [Planctomycetota bacterium]